MFGLDSCYLVRISCPIHDHHGMCNQCRARGWNCVILFLILCKQLKSRLINVKYCCNSIAHNHNRCLYQFHISVTKTDILLSCPNISDTSSYISNICCAYFRHFPWKAETVSHQMKAEKWENLWFRTIQMINFVNRKTLQVFSFSKWTCSILKRDNVKNTT